MVIQPSVENNIGRGKFQQWILSRNLERASFFRFRGQRYRAAGGGAAWSTWLQGSLPRRMFSLPQDFLAEGVAGGPLDRAALPRRRGPGAFAGVGVGKGSGWRLRGCSAFLRGLVAFAVWSGQFTGAARSHKERQTTKSPAQWPGVGVCRVVGQLVAGALGRVMRAAKWYSPAPRPKPVKVSTAPTPG